MRSAPSIARPSPSAGFACGVYQTPPSQQKVVARVRGKRRIHLLGTAPAVDSDHQAASVRRLCTLCAENLGSRCDPRVFSGQDVVGIPPHNDVTILCAAHTLRESHVILIKARKPLHRFHPNPRMQRKAYDAN